MGTSPSADISKRLVAMTKVVSPEATRKRLQRLSKKLVAEANKVPSGDLGGDAEFSGWKRIGPLQAKATPHSDGMGVTIGRAPKSAGGWRVAQSGRNQGETGLFAGPGVNRSTGATYRTKTGKLRKVRQRSKRWNGRTAGKGTWDKVTVRLSAITPKEDSNAAREDMAKAFKGG